MNDTNLNYLSILIYICWLASEVVLNMKLRSVETDKKGADKNSIRVIWITLSIACTAGFFLAGSTPFPIGNYRLVHLIGLLMILIGMMLRFMAVRSLGNMFTVDVTIRQDHALNTSGMYKYLRHPSYSASLLSFLGLGVALNNWLSLAVVFIPVLISFIYRVNIEEAVLQEQFGDEYRNYMKKSYRFLPFVY